MLDNTTIEAKEASFVDFHPNMAAMTFLWEWLQTKNMETLASRYFKTIKGIRRPSNGFHVITYLPA